MIATDLCSLARFVWSHPETTHHRISAFGRVLAWQLWQRLVRRPLTVRFDHGIRLRCYPHSTSASGVIYCKFPEWREMQLVRHLLSPGDVLIDVGANIGVYTLIACMSNDVRVWAFEPSSESMERLQENVRLNRLDNRVVLEQKAVASAVGSARLTRGLDSVNRLASPDETGPTENVQITTVDLAVPRPPSSALTILKIDVEGAELAVLEGAADLLCSALPVIIAERNDPVAVTSFLAKLDYRPYDYDPITRTLTEIPVVSDAQQNMIFIANIEMARRRLGDQMIQSGRAHSVRPPVE